MKYLHLQTSTIIPIKTLSLLLMYITCSVSFAENSEYLNELKGEATQKITQNKSVTKNNADKIITPSTKALKESSYLDGLSAEADETNIDNSSAISSEEIKEKNSTKQIERWNINSQNLSGLRSGLKWKEFETVLKNSYFASYVFYKRLDPTSKSLVFKSYENKASIKQIRAKIISLSR